MPCTESNVHPLPDTDSLPCSHSQVVLTASGVCCQRHVVTLYRRWRCCTGGLSLGPPMQQGSHECWGFLLRVSTKPDGSSSSLFGVTNAVTVKWSAINIAQTMVFCEFQLCGSAGGYTRGSNKPANSHHVIQKCFFFFGFEGTMKNMQFLPYLLISKEVLLLRENEDTYI